MPGAVLPRQRQPIPQVRAGVPFPWLNVPQREPQTRFRISDSWPRDEFRIRGLEMMSRFALEVRLVSFGAPSGAILQMAENFD